MHSIVTIFILVCLVALGVVGITSYLSIDDLKDCSARPQPASEKCAKADAIVAVSGGDTGARAEEAVRLYQEGWANTIIFSGAAEDTSGPSNAMVMRRIAIDADVPAARILIEESSLDTQDNAIATNELLKSRGFKRIILVTSPYHQHRAYLEFKRNVPDSITILNHPTPNDHLWPSSWWMTAQGWTLAITEVVKTFFVQVRGEV